MREKTGKVVLKRIVSNNGVDSLKFQFLTIFAYHVSTMTKKILWTFKKQYPIEKKSVERSIAEVKPVVLAVV